MAELIWTEPALSDLERVAEYIAYENPQAARALVKRVFSVVGRLADHPKSGKIPEELPKNVFRELVCGPCRIFYRCANNKVFVLHIMRSEQVLRKFILEDRGKL